VFTFPPLANRVIDDGSTRPLLAAKEAKPLNERKRHIGAGMQTSPWIILGATAILLVVVVVLAVQNTARERRFMTATASTATAG